MMKVYIITDGQVVAYEGRRISGCHYGGEKRQPEIHLRLQATQVVALLELQKRKLKWQQHEIKYLKKWSIKSILKEGTSFCYFVYMYILYISGWSEIPRFLKDSAYWNKDIFVWFKTMREKQILARVVGIKNDP